MSAHPFTLTPAVLKSLQSAWRVQLSPELVAVLEDIARLVILVRSVVSLSAEERASIRKEVKAGHKRHAAIVKTAEQLVQLLQGDRQERMNLAAKTTHYNRLVAYSLREPIEKAVPLLSDIVELASSKYPDPLEELVTPKFRRKKGRPRSEDGWNDFIRNVVDTYEKATGKSATASWSEHKGAQDSPFLRGLLKLHEALPANVQVRKTNFLGSRTNSILKDKRARTKLAKCR